MDKVKKLLPLLLIAAVALLASCASAPKPTDTVAPSQPTDTGASQAPVTTATTVPAASVPSTVAPVQPSVPEAELRNLFGRVGTARNDAVENGLDSVLPDRFAAAEQEYQAARGRYETAIAATPYDGVAAYPVKGALETSLESWTALYRDGMPELANRERNAALDARLQAQSAGADMNAEDRFLTAEDLFAAGDSRYDASDFAQAVESYRFSADAYRSSAEKGLADSQRASILDNGYAQYAPLSFEEAEDLYRADQAAWASGDYAASAKALKSANSLYGETIARGSEARANESRFAAAEAKAKADSINASVNAPSTYAAALESFNGANGAYASKDYAGSTPGYESATKGFKDAYAESEALKAKAESAYSGASADVDASQQRASDAGLGDNEHIVAARRSLEASRVAIGEGRYADAMAAAEEARHHAMRSDEYVASMIAQREAEKRAAEKAAAERAEIEKMNAVKEEAKAAELRAEEQKKAEEQKRVEEEKKVAQQQADLAAEARREIDRAAEKQAWAKSVNAVNNYPEKYSEGSYLLDMARLALGKAEAQAAIDKAKAAYDVFAGIPEFAELPAEYTVRLIPERRDCLWRIAEYPFIYNNPLKWPVLYEANKKTFKDPSNPDLIFPRQVLKVPSVKGETRSGMWDPSKTYKPLEWDPKETYRKKK